MKKSVLLVAAVASVLGVASVPAFSALPGLVPLPVSVTEDAGAPAFQLKDSTVIAYRIGEEGAAAAATFFAKEFGLKSVGLKPNEVPPAGCILLSSESTSGKPAEFYTLAVGRENVKLGAGSYGGFFYAMQTLRQLLPAGKVRGDIPACQIMDYPRFAWRGMMLDSCRHYQSLDWIKKLIDMLASQKINTLHWHLSDDQGWRLEIKKYPKLTKSAAWRNGIGFGLDPKSSSHYRKDGLYGGFYTQEQAKELVKYAAERNITIVPEIEMPGHALAALTVYPELGCTGGPYNIGMVGGVFADVYCAGNDKTYKFLENVLTEVAAIFPSEFIHVGGDECPKDRWKKCPKCQAKIKSKKLHGESGLQSYLIKHMEKFLAGKGKRLIGWDEILEGGLPERASVMSWRGASGGITAASAGHDVVMTPTDFCYIDYYQAKEGEPRAIGGFLPLEKVYSFNPVAGVPADKQAHVLGCQANLWTEYIPNEKHTEYMIAPRISALAEVAWTPQNLRSWKDFTARLVKQCERYEAAGFNYRYPKEVYGDRKNAAAE